MAANSPDPAGPSVALAALLAAIAGYVDALSYLDVGTFVANMTGNTVLLGIGMVRWDWHAVSRSGGSIVAFVLGVILARGLLQPDARYRRPLVATIMLLLLAAFVSGGPRLLALAAAMGLQDAAMTHFGGTTINTVFVTGDLVQLGTAVATWRTGAQAARRAAHLAAVWVCYLGGASLGGFAAGLYLHSWHGVDMRFVAVAGLLSGMLLVPWSRTGRRGAAPSPARGQAPGP